MLSPRIRVLGIGSLAAAGLVENARPQSPDPAIVSAYAAPDGVTFAAPVDLGWGSRIPEELRPASLAVDSARRWQLYEQRSEQFITELLVALEIPPELLARTYHLLDASGAYPIRPNRLELVVSVNWGEAAGEVRSVGAFAMLHASARPGSSGGFVTATNSAVTLAEAPSSYTADDLWAPTGESYPHRGTDFWPSSASTS